MKSYTRTYKTAVFGQRLRQYRIAIGLTQEELANLIGCTKGQVSAFEAANTLPTPERMAFFADGLGLQGRAKGRFMHGIYAYLRQPQAHLARSSPATPRKRARQLGPLQQASLAPPKPPKRNLLHRIVHGFLWGPDL